MSRKKTTEQEQRIRQVTEGALIGLLAGLTVATLGAIKDTTFEPFEWGKFIRSPIIGAVWGTVGNAMFKEPDKILLYTFAISTERITIETWKALQVTSDSYMPGKFNSPTLDKGWLYQKSLEG